MEIGNVVQVKDCGEGLLLKKVSRDEWLVLLAENNKSAMTYKELPRYFVMMGMKRVKQRHFPCPYSSFASLYLRCGSYRCFKRRFLVVPEMFMKKKKDNVGSFWWKHDTGGLYHAGW